MGSVYQEVIDSYKDTGSILETAEQVGISKVKVQRILITEGMWTSKSSDLIGHYYSQKLSTAEIAKLLNMSIKNVQAYIPYSKGEYCALTIGNPKRSRIYRERVRCVKMLEPSRNANNFWKTVSVFENYPFCIARGKTFKYVLEKDTLMINRKIPLSKAALQKAFESAVERGTLEECRSECVDFISVMFKRWKLLSLAEH